MSLHSVGSDTHYVLPSSMDSIPEAFRSCKSAKPIPCALQSVNVVSLSGTQNQGGSSIIQIPAGAGAGLMMNPYIRFSLQFTGTGAANANFAFKGAVQAASMAIQSIQTYVNSVQVDNLQNAWQIYDNLLCHSTSNDWLQHDGSLMLGTGVVFTPTSSATSSPLYTFCVPLLGLLGSQSAMPLYLLNGTLQIQINWQPNVAAVYQSGATIPLLSGSVALTDPLWTGFNVQNVQCVYDKITPESAFVDKVRHDMMNGAKYVFSYTNYASTAVNVTSTAQVNLNYGLNVSSLRGVVMMAYNTSLLTAAGNAAGTGSISNGLTQFQVSLDGRLISSIPINVTTDPALVFAELQKAYGRIFDASITSPVTSTTTAGAQPGGSFLTQYFAAGASAQRVNEGLAYQGSPCSFLNVAFVPSTGTATSNYFLLISDQQILIDATGSIELVR